MTVAGPTVEWRRALRHALRIQRRQSLAWIAIFSIAGASTVRGYISAYPSHAGREALARSLGDNIGFQTLYGVARNIDTVGGFTAWRLTWLLVTLTGMWGLLAATRLIRGEEESGHSELLVTGGVTRRGLLGADVVAVALPLVVCAVTFGATLALSGIPSRSAFVLSAGIMAPGLIFGAIGALTSQLFEDRRHATAWASGALGASFLIRVAADGTTTLGWLRWATPLGWVENLQPFAGTRAIVVVPISCLTATFLVGAFFALDRRDFGAGLVATADRGNPNSRLLRSITGFAVKRERASVLAWSIGVGGFAFVFGLLGEGVSKFMRSQTQLQDFLHSYGLRSYDRPEDFLGLVFTIFALPIAIYAVMQVSAAREEEATGRLEVLIARPVNRGVWLLSRCAVAAVGALVVTLFPALAAWFGAALQHSGVSLEALVVAAMNCLPVAMLFFGIAVLSLGIAPRLTAGVALGGVVGAYLLELVGAILKAPTWVLDLSPFHHLAPAPAAPVNAGAAAIMMAIGLVLTAAGVMQMARRDLVGA